MLFNSVEYLFFFVLVVAIFFAIPRRIKWLYLLVASLYFYSCWRFDYLILLVSTILVSYWCAVKLESEQRKSHKKFYYWLGLGVNFGQLFVFKYFDFTIENVNSALSAFNIFYHFPYLKWALPIGISFHVFQITAYLIDVYKGEIKAEKHLGIFSLFVCFFPQLVAGPIEQGKLLLPQLRDYKGVNAGDVTFGLQLMLWGAFQKIVIADNLSQYVKVVFQQPEKYSFLPVATAMCFFTIQVYCDFAGYSSIARGTARVMGYDMVVNFDKPFFSKSVTEFWRRWHISLTSWFTKYVYTPVVISIRNLESMAPVIGVLILFLLSGLWHGANWAFVCYGLMHGLYVVVELLTKKNRKKWKKKIGETLFDTGAIFITLLLVTFAFVFFRAGTLEKSFTVYQSLLKFDFSLAALLVDPVNFGLYTMLIYVFLVFVLFLLEWFDFKKALFSKFYASPQWLRWSVYFIAIWCIIILGNMDHQEFIYFQF